MGFGQRLSEAVRRRRSQIVLGLDPDPGRLWPGAVPARAEDGSTPADQAAGAVLAHCRLVLAAVASECVAVKPQVACFERLGAPGWEALAAVVAVAREHGLLVIADAKRGDVDFTAAAYGQAFFGGVDTPFGPIAGLGVDALTANPLLGRDSVSSLLAGARATGGGLFVLVRTSNPGAAEIQGQRLAAGADVSDLLAGLVAELGAEGIGPDGIADLGAVVGATAPEHVSRLRAAMPATPFLLPGVGPQGGGVELLAPAFAPGPAGGLVSASRGIVYAFEAAGGEPGTAARAEAARLREIAWGLS